ncbi:hypothetical protein [Marisediminicola senii]|uniref:hypothetical protein n=1 Tax=Marisediminicola senii TaxID=2711233 RepID=UPI0013EDF7E5|nr:hypothetical protein [Marisediminicola senii]
MPPRNTIAQLATAAALAFALTACGPAYTPTLTPASPSAGADAGDGAGDGSTGDDGAGDGDATDGADGGSDQADAEPSPLLPVWVEEFTLEYAQTETTRVGDRIAGLVAVAGLLNDDDYSQEVEAVADGRYWGIIHTITLDPSVDSAAQAESVVATLDEAGWITRESTDTGESTLTALSSSEQSDQSWFLVIGADLSVEGQSVVTVQLASPNIP